jgi:putative transcriptional regulator
MILLLRPRGLERGSDVHNGLVSSRSAQGIPIKGQLLVATPPLEDPHFDRTVVHMIDHGDDGAVGVVINRPTDAQPADPVDRWSHLMVAPAVLFAGGPVEQQALIGLAEADGDDEAWSNVGDHLASVDLSLDPGLVAHRVRRLRVFRGYSGWSAGQLEAEIEQGAWIVVPSTLDDVFSPRPQELWRTVLRRQGGRLAWIANAPDDLSAN